MNEIIVKYETTGRMLKKRSLGSDTLNVFLCLETQVYKYICVIVDHWFFWVTG